MGPSRVAAGTRRAPLFVISGLEGPPHPGLPLAAALEATTPCYGLTLPGRAGDGPALDDVQAMTVHLLCELLAVQPVGPYRLAGYASGGILAYALGRLLRGLGQQVGPIVLLDSVLPLAGHPTPPRRRTLALGELVQIRHLACRWQGACRCGVDLTAPLDGQAVRVAHALGAPAPDRYEQTIEAAVDVYTAALRALAAHQPGPSDLHAVLIRSADWTNLWALPSQLARHTSPCLGWEHVELAGLRLHVIPTDRPALLAEPALWDVATLVAHYLPAPTLTPPPPAPPPALTPAPEVVFPPAAIPALSAGPAVSVR